MILFLDFDGVLHPRQSEADQLFCCAPLLWALLHLEPALQVVFSTSWRSSFGFDDLLNFATFGGGETLVDRFLGATPTLLLDPTRNITGAVYRRELECQAWLGIAAARTTWLALDDERCNFPQISPHCYWVEAQLGLQPTDIAAIRTRLAAL